MESNNVLMLGCLRIVMQGTVSLQSVQVKFLSAQPDGGASGTMMLQVHGSISISRSGGRQNHAQGCERNVRFSTIRRHARTERTGNPMYSFILCM